MQQGERQRSPLRNCRLGHRPGRPWCGCVGRAGTCAALPALSVEGGRGVELTAARQTPGQGGSSAKEGVGGHRQGTSTVTPPYHALATGEQPLCAPRQLAGLLPTAVEGEPSLRAPRARWPNKVQCDSSTHRDEKRRTNRAAIIVEHKQHGEYAQRAVPYSNASNEAAKRSLPRVDNTLALSAMHTQREISRAK